MRELHLGGKPPRKGISTKDLIDWQAGRQRLEAEAEAKLAYRKREWVGNFDTELPCVCGATIVDHATIHDPNRNVPVMQIRMGPQPEPRERLAAFRVEHAYWCDTCGLKYQRTVIEEVRGYVPRDKRPEFAG